MWAILPTILPYESKYKVCPSWQNSCTEKYWSGLTAFPSNISLPRKQRKNWAHYDSVLSHSVVQATLQYLVHCSARLYVTYSAKIFLNFLSIYLNMPKNVPPYLGFHGVYNTSLYWVLIILQSTTEWTIAQHKTPIWYLASRLVLQNNCHLFSVKIQGHHFIWKVFFVTSFQPTYVLK